MLFEYEYRTIEKESTGEYRDRGSRFIGFCYPVKTEPEVKEFLKKIKKDHPKANHHCYAFRLGPAKTIFRFSDDREPSGTAGKPVFGVIQSNDLTDILIIVVRYFGGSLLGVSGLINAYRTAALEAVKSNSIVTKPIVERYELGFEYPMMSEVMLIIRQSKATVLHQDLTEKCILQIEIPRIMADEFLAKLNNSQVLKNTVQIKIL